MGLYTGGGRALLECAGGRGGQEEGQGFHQKGDLHQEGRHGAEKGACFDGGIEERRD
jgi:hypothetical protein